MVSWEQEQYNEKVLPIHTPFILNVKKCENQMIVEDFNHQNSK
jgi:hypothetical protein